jgi:hypothetical protein
MEKKTIEQTTMKNYEAPMIKTLILELKSTVLTGSTTDTDEEEQI